MEQVSSLKDDFSGFVLVSCEETSGEKVASQAIPQDVRMENFRGGWFFNWNIHRIFTVLDPCRLHDKIAQAVNQYLESEQPHILLPNTDPKESWINGSFFLQRGHQKSVVTALDLKAIGEEEKFLISKGAGRFGRTPSYFKELVKSGQAFALIVVDLMDDKQSVKVITNENYESETTRKINYMYFPVAMITPTAEHPALNAFRDY